MVTDLLDTGGGMCVCACRRAQQMTDAVRALFERVWSKGEVALIDTLVSEDFVWKDAIWASTRPVVGRKAFCAFVGQMRQAYPDLAYTVEQVDDAACA
jgi:hypothetical protein